MNNVSVLHPVTSNRELSLIRNTVAKDCTDDEFNLFIHTARHLRLDPLRRQIYVFIYNKKDTNKRRMSIVTAIDGFRAIADRTGNYRPDEEDPDYEIDQEAKSPLNPIGLVKVTVRVFKFSHGEWHKVTASAYWDEYAPIKDEWDGGVRTGKQILDTSGNWGKMPRLMLAKVAEALAIRKAWPDDFSNVYSQEEVEKSRVLDDVLPSEAASLGEVEKRLEFVGSANKLQFDFDLSGINSPELISLGQVADRVMRFLKENEGEPTVISLWQQRNVHSLREFWARSKSDALEVKKAIEKASAPIIEQEGLEL